MGRWLDSEEQATWRAFLDVNARLLELLEADLQQQGGIALTDYEILVMLAEAPERRLRMSELAEQVIVSRSRLTYRVDRLAEKGLVERIEFEGDRRGVLASLTASGFEKLESLAPGHVDLVRSSLFDMMNRDELAVMHAVLERVSKACSEGNP